MFREIKINTVRKIGLLICGGVLSIASASAASLQDMQFHISNKSSAPVLMSKHRVYRGLFSPIAPFTMAPNTEAMASAHYDHWFFGSCESGSFTINSQKDSEAACLITYYAYGDIFGHSYATTADNPRTYFPVSGRWRSSGKLHCTVTEAKTSMPQIQVSDQ